ncbi:MAG: hypothetical protein Alpg2KO_27200 [Alphaproteobacteria bacterium]
MFKDSDGPLNGPDNDKKNDPETGAGNSPDKSPEKNAGKTPEKGEGDSPEERPAIRFLNAIGRVRLAKKLGRLTGLDFVSRRMTELMRSEKDSKPALSPARPIRFKEEPLKGDPWKVYPVKAMGAKPFGARAATEDNWRLEDGQKPLIGGMPGDHGGLLRYAVWLPPKAKKPKKGETAKQPDTIVLCMGRNEPLEKYQHEAERWVAKGYQVFALDWQGQGLSSRFHAEAERGIVPDYGVHVRDLNRFMGTIVEPHATGKLLLKANSMGGHIATRYLQEIDQSKRARPLDGAIMTSPMYRIRFPAFSPEWASKKLAQVEMRLGRGENYAPLQGRWRRSVFKNNTLMTDKPRFDTFMDLLAANPDLRIGGASFKWLYESIVSSDRLMARGALERIKVPMLLFEASEDDVVRRSAIRRAAARISGAKLVSIGHDSRHDLPHETDAALKDMDAEIDRFAKGLTPPKLDRRKAVKSFAPAP